MNHLPRTAALTILLATLSLIVLFESGCAADEDDYQIVEPIQQSGLALSSGGLGSRGLPTNVAGARTEVWAATNAWSDTNTTAARAAGPAWDTNSGLNWEEKYSLWIQGLEKTSIHNSNQDTFTIVTPEGKSLDVPALECAELAMMMRAVFSSWHHLPFFVEARDGNSNRIFLGHFGFRTLEGRYGNTPNYRTRYDDFSGLSNEDALANWPSDSNLRGRHLYGGGPDTNSFLGDDAGAGYYFDELLLNKRVGHFLLVLLPYFGSINLADDANSYHATPQSLRAGDVLLKRWRRRGIGHVLLVKDVQNRPEGKKAAELASGSMPRRQAKWESQASSKMLFTAQTTGGEGENSEGERYVDLGGGLKRWLSAERSGGKWRNRVLATNLDEYLAWSRKEERAARPEQFADLLVTVPPDELRDELLDIIEDKRAWLRDHPSSCSARHGREAAFEELYNLLQSRFGMAREQVDAEYRNYEDYVFADLSYNESKTCCWNSTSRAMYDVVMSYNLSRQEEAQACLAPTVFKAQNGGYQTFSDHAQSIGQGAAWVPWSADETCPQANVANDLESTHGWTPFCEVSDAILNRGEEGSETSGETAGTDPFEPNDSRGTAHLLAEGSFEGARIAENDSDWFTFEPPTDSIVRFSIAFEHGDGDLDLRMYRGEQVADRSTSTHDEESVDLSFDGNEPISVQVYGYEGATGDYRITVSFDGGVATGDPCNDSNETQETAFEIGEGTYNGLRICEGDIDWFRIPATTSQGAITVEFNPGTGDLDIALYKSNGTLIDSSTTTSGVETVESGPGLRFLKVYGYNGATGDYTLRINE